MMCKLSPARTDDMDILVIQAFYKSEILKYFASHTPIKVQKDG